MSENGNDREGASAGSVLVVDDYPGNISVLTGILQGAGYSVRAAISGVVALDSIEVSLPDIVLLDIRMPIMDGFEVCHRIRADERTREIPVIFISALEEREDKARAFSEGGSDYIVKPFQAEEVLARVATHLELARARKVLRERNAASGD